MAVKAFNEASGYFSVCSLNVGYMEIMFTFRSTDPKTNQNCFKTDQILKIAIFISQTKCVYSQKKLDFLSWKPNLKLQKHDDTLYVGHYRKEFL